MAVSAAEVQAERDAYLGTDPPPFLREMVAMLPAPATKPACTELLVDSEGCVWPGQFQSRVNLDRPRAVPATAPGVDHVSRRAPTVPDGPSANERWTTRRSPG